jgi:hypothetical protein
VALKYGIISMTITTHAPAEHSFGHQTAATDSVDVTVDIFTRDNIICNLPVSWEDVFLNCKFNFKMQNGETSFSPEVKTASSTCHTLLVTVFRLTHLIKDSSVKFDYFTLVSV